jgi:hypothetical protein
MAMTKDEFQAACKRHGLTVAEFAAEFGVAESTAYGWGQRSGIPYWAVKIIAVMDQHGTAAIISQRASVRPTEQPPAAINTPPRPRHLRKQHPATA